LLVPNVAMVNRVPEREPEFLRERAAALRKMAKDMPSVISKPLLEVAASHERDPPIT